MTRQLRIGKDDLAKLVKQKVGDIVGASVQVVRRQPVEGEVIRDEHELYVVYSIEDDTIQLPATAGA
jgi:hypothetical protein